MADATIGVLESTDAAAKKVDNDSLTVGADTVHRQRVRIAGAAATDLATVTGGRVSVDGSGVTQPVSAASLPLPAGASQEHVAAASPHAARLTDGAAFYKATTPADTQPVSAAALPLPTGASTEATLAAMATDLGDQADAAAAANGSLIGIVKRLRTLLAGGLPAGLVGGRLDANVGNTPAVTVSGAVDTELTTADLDTGAGTDTRAVVGLALAASGGAVLAGAANPVPVSDNAGSLTVDSGQLPAALVGARLDVNIGATAVTQPVSGTVTADTELPAAAALADAAANPTSPTVGGANLVFNGVTWDRARGDITNGLDVDVTRLPALPTGTNNIGDVDVLTLPALPAGANNIGDVDIASAPTGASSIQNQGAAAHDAPAAGNPLAIGFRANANEPAAVSTDADAVFGWADLFGRQVVVTGHPNPEAPVTVNATASGATTVIAAPGASISIYVLKASVHNRDATNRLVDLRDGAAGTVRWRAELAAEGGGALIDFGERGWKLTANTLLAVNLDAAGNVDVNITAYYLAA